MKNALLPYSSKKWQRKACEMALCGSNKTKDISLPFPGHIRASELIDIIGYDQYKKFFTFAIVRNPWDWQVSLYRYMLKNITHPQHDFIKQLDNFHSYVVWRCKEEVRLQRDFIYSDQGELLINFVGRFENIDNDFSKICSQIGITATLPRLNVSNTRPYQDFYNARSKDLVWRAFKDDIELFEYEF